MVFGLGWWAHGRQATPVAAELAVVRDSLHSAVVLFEAFQKSDTLPREADEQLARADSLHRIRTHRAAAPQQPPPADTDTTALQWWKDRVDTLEVWMAQANEEASLNRSAAITYREAHRQAVEAASRLYVSAMVAEGRLNQILPKVADLERKAKGCRLPLVGIKCPAIGVGLIVGADLKPQPGIAVVIPL